VCLLFLTILSYSFAQETVDSLKGQLAAKNAEIAKLKAQLQECDLGSLLQKKGKEVADFSAVYFGQALDVAQKGFAWVSQNAQKYGKIVAAEAQKYSALAGVEINKLAKQYKLEGHLEEADKTWRNLVKTSVNQVSESVPQTAPYLKSVKENPILVAQLLAALVGFLFLSCCLKCCCGRRTPKTVVVVPPTTTTKKTSKGRSK